MPFPSYSTAELTSWACAATFAEFVAGVVEGVALGHKAICAFLAAAGWVLGDASLLAGRAVLDGGALQAVSND